MGKAANVATGILGGTTTKLARTVTRRVMRRQNGAPRLPRAARRRQGIGTMLAWAAALGVLLAIVDVLREQRSASAPPS